MKEMEAHMLEGGANVAIQACCNVNGDLTEFAKKRWVIIRATLEAVYAVTHLILPFIPKGEC